jgi:hypothetical protein
MVIQTIGELFKILGRDPNRLVGEKETKWLDFKSEPHVTPGGKTEPHHRLALAKDVCAMANAGGGILLIGFGRKGRREHAEVAAELRPIGQVSSIPNRSARSWTSGSFRPWKSTSSLTTCLGESKLWTLTCRAVRRPPPFLSCARV